MIILAVGYLYFMFCCCLISLTCCYGVLLLIQFAMNSSEEQGGVVPSEKYKEALTTLKRKIFGDYTTDTKVEIESCAICLESFT